MDRGGGIDDELLPNEVCFSGDNVTAMQHDNVVITHCCNNSAMSQIDRSTRTEMADDNGLKVDRGGGIDDELLSIDIQSLVAVRERQQTERANYQLNSIVDTLMNSHVVKSLPISIALSETCFLAFSCVWQ